MPRLKRARPRRRLKRRRPVNVLPNILTISGLSCGVASIFAGIAGRYERAAYLIAAAVIFDVFDGTVAKITKGISEFGKQLDSLCDLVSFGIAPAVLIYTAFLQEGQAEDSITSRVGSVIAIIFVICGALRLARYNVYQSTLRDSFIGLPIPAAGSTIAAFVLFVDYFQLKVAFWVLGPLTLALAYLMVSTVKYPKDRLKVFVLAPQNAFRFLVLCVVGVAVFQIALVHLPSVALLPIALGYVLFGIADGATSHLHQKQEQVPGQPVVQAAASPAEPPRPESSPSKTGDLL